MNQPPPHQLSASQLATVHLCAQEESSVIEVLQEIKTSGSDVAHLKELLISELFTLGQQGKLNFYLDDFTSGLLEDISLEAARNCMGEAATWDVHNPVHLHLRWTGS